MGLFSRLFSRLFGLEKVSIQYRNYLGEKKTFVAKKRSLYKKGIHCNARVQPTNQYIALHKDRIRNLKDWDTLEFHPID